MPGANGGTPWTCVRALGGHTMVNKRPIPSPEVATFLAQFADPLAAYYNGHSPETTGMCVICGQLWPCDLMHWVDTALDDSSTPPESPSGAA